MRPDVEPQIIPPSKSGRLGISGLSDETLSLLASLLDDIFRVPGTNVRFGLDPVVGLIPGIGDLITGLASFVIIFSGWQRRIPTITVARMVANVAIDTLLGAIPVVGDAFDVTWKSNRKNIQLLQRAALMDPREQTWRDWLFLFGIVVALVLLIAIPVVVLTLVVNFILQHR